MAKQDNSAREDAYSLPFEKPVLHLQKQISDLEAEQVKTGRDIGPEIRQLRTQFVSLLRKTYQDLSAWETVQVARHPQRPIAGDYIQRIVKNFAELHGDRRFGDDRAIRAGLGRIGTEKVAPHRPAQGTRHQREDRLQLRLPAPRGLS